MKTRILFLIAIIPAIASFSFAQSKAENSKQRAEILKALSVPVSKELKQKVAFTTEAFKVRGNWAFISGEPTNAKGRAVNWKITRYQKFIDRGDFEEGLYALLKKTGGRWKVVTYLMNCHDVCYLGWDRKYKAPKALFE